jgi:hypothetical protein
MPKLPKFSKKWTLIVAGALVGISAVGAAAFLYIRNNDPERLFYAAIAEEPTKEIYESVMSYDNSDVTLTDSAYLKKYDTIKEEGKLVCEGSSEASGETNMTVSLVGVNESQFFKFDEITSSSMGDAETDAQIAEDFKALSGKWIQITANDPSARGFIQEGLLFNPLGAISKEFSQKRIVEILKEEKVVTILSTKDTKREGKAVVEYEVQIRRSAYEKFMDRLHSGFQYKDDVLDTIFEDDDESWTVVVDKKSKTIVEERFSAPNPCVEFLGMVDSDAAAEAPTRLRMKYVPGADKKVKNVEAPKEFVTMEELFESLYEEETEE